MLPNDRVTPFDHLRCEHMLIAAQQAVSFIKGRSRTDLDTDHMLRRAIKDCIQEIGEAATKISPACKDAHPDIPWKQIVGMRHILVHVYFDLDNDALWKVVEKDLPTLIKNLHNTLENWPKPPSP